MNEDREARWHAVYAAELLRKQEGSIAGTEQAAPVAMAHALTALALVATADPVPGAVQA